jgi:hypothetical protein
MRDPQQNPLQKNIAALEPSKYVASSAPSSAPL